LGPFLPAGRVLHAWLAGPKIVIWVPHLFVWGFKHSPEFFTGPIITSRTLLPCDITLSTSMSCPAQIQFQDTEKQMQ